MSVIHNLFSVIFTNYIRAEYDDVQQIFHQVSFQDIASKTFHSNDVISMISEKTGYPTSTVSSSLLDPDYRFQFIYEHLRNKLYTAIILNLEHEINELLTFDRCIDDKCYYLAALNNHTQILKCLEQYSNHRIDSRILYYSVGNTELYFHYRQLGHQPNISILEKAITCGNAEICRDILKVIGFGKHTLELAFEHNDTGIIKQLIAVAKDDNVTLTRNLIAYSISNNNREIIDCLADATDIVWHNELYFPALLSGDMDMILYVESKLPQLHQQRQLDTINYQGKKTTILSKEITYYHKSTPYYSHTLNYAIQSNNLCVVKYIHALGYDITISNMITCIRQSTSDILEYLCQNYVGTLPYHIVYYFSPLSVVNQKEEKLKLILSYNILELQKSIDKVDDAKLISTHIDIITNNQIVPDVITDPDYLFNHSLLVGTKNNKEMDLVVLSRIYTFDPTRYISLIEPHKDSPVVINSIFLYGTILDVKRLVLEHDTTLIASERVIAQLFYYRQIAKLAYIYRGHEDILGLYRIMGTMINDELISQFISKLPGNHVVKIEYLVESRDIERLLQYIHEHPVSSLKIVKKLLLLNNHSLAAAIDYSRFDKGGLSSWMDKMDLLEFKQYL